MIKIDKRIPWQSTPPMHVPLNKDNWLTRGLVGLWDAREPTGPAYNRAGLDADGAPQAGVTRTWDEFGPQYEFANSYIDIGTSNTVRITGAFTIVAWGTHLGTNNYRPYLSCWDAGGSQGYGLSVNNTNKLRLDCYSSGTVTLTGATNVGTGFRMVAGTVRENKPSEVWLDGVSDGTTTMSGFPTTTSGYARIGDDGANRFWTGVIPRVLLYNRGLSTAEIISLRDDPNQIYMPFQSTFWGGAIAPFPGGPLFRSKHFTPARYFA
ncbi:MAG: hypothetical protein JKX85_06170 [Phycisphaeraceae bacterium]|nr:hypothetical protein [Phycisphaeraceae bacterium]